MDTSWFLRLSWDISASSVYCRHHYTSKVLNVCVLLLWFGLIFSVLFFPPLFFFFFFYFQEKPKNSIKKNHSGCPSLFWLFDQPYSTGATLHKKQYHVYALAKRNHNSSYNSNKKLQPSQHPQYQKCSRFPIIPQLDSFILCTYSIVGNKIYMLKKKAYHWCYSTEQGLLYSVICGLWRKQKANVHSWRLKKILFCMITIGNIVM